MNISKTKLTLARLLFICAITSLAAFAMPAHAQVTSTTVKDLINGPILVLHKSTNFVASQYNVISVPQGKDLLIIPQWYGGDATNTGTGGLKMTSYYGGLGTNGFGTNTSTTVITLTSTANGVTAVRQPIVLLSTTLGPANGIAFTGFTNNTFGTDVTGGSLTLSNCLAQWRNN